VDSTQKKVEYTVMMVCDTMECSFTPPHSTTSQAVSVDPVGLKTPMGSG